MFVLIAGLSNEITTDNFLLGLSLILNVYDYSAYFYYKLFKSLIFIVIIKTFPI